MTSGVMTKFGLIPYPDCEDLHLACCIGCMEIVDHVVKDKAKQAPTLSHLMMACKAGHLDIVRYLIKAGVQPTTEVLEVACGLSYDRDMLRCLIFEHGLIPTAKHLKKALDSDQVGAVRFILSVTDLKVAPEELDLARQRGWMNMVRYLACEVGLKPIMPDRLSCSKLPEPAEPS